ncbi:MAG: hypothetical protein LBI42_04175 [Chitinispirillales bacterium]|nr:hypothetical protein [Chitinispirillales bacterium]
MYDSNDSSSIEKYSSAVTLSDMEVFIFPDLMYSLVLANIMSPGLWKWKDDPWFSKMSDKKELKRVQRLKQYIIDHFSFNLDLDTWGLTTKEKELKRFSKFIDVDILAKSNALFGYEGDKYYFDIDIRRHFNLDKYDSNVIPYWKTETLEAMEAFRFKEGYANGAGECVSFSALYAAAAFVLADIPLEKIFLLATPLHSQNYLDVDDGIITNNRRIVTKNMWYNGTELSAKARRAIENEIITIVAHNSGYIHTMYSEASIDANLYKRFKDGLTRFLSTEITYEIVANFLRHNSSLQNRFQISHLRNGRMLFIEAEKVYCCESTCKFRVGDTTQQNLLLSIDENQFTAQARSDRFVLAVFEEFFRDNKTDPQNPDHLQRLKTLLRGSCLKDSDIIDNLVKFCRITPKLPHEQRVWKQSEPVTLDGIKSAKDAQESLKAQAKYNPTANLAFMAFRDLSSSPWKPFIKAAVERNPVCVNGAGNLELNDAYKLLSSFAENSIYGEPTRLAQPDEVWNYKRGDGLEKAITLASIYMNKQSENRTAIDTDGKNIKLTCGNQEFLFETQKELTPPISSDWPA